VLLAVALYLLLRPVETSSPAHGTEASGVEDRLAWSAPGWARRPRARSRPLG